MPSALSTINRESELSYAYLHAVASHAGVNCKITNRHDDNAGIDAVLTGWAPFENGGYLTEVDIKVQLKATIKPPSDDGLTLSYFLSDVRQYDNLRCETYASPRLLTVLFLPAETEEWITHSDESLILRRCAYWVSLRGAPATENRSGVTVRLPKSQRFDVAGLKQLMSALSHHRFPNYRGSDER